MSKESKKRENSSATESSKDDSSSIPPESQEHSECDTLKKEMEQLKVQCLRATADLENFKRRMEKEQSQWHNRAQERVLLDLLAVVDDFDRAMAERQDQEPSEELKGWFEGFELIYKSLQKLLQQYDVHEIEQMTEFDPHLHEAVSQVDSPDHESGHIVEVLQKGYMFKDAVLRPAKVVVAQ